MLIGGNSNPGVSDLYDTEKKQLRGIVYAMRLKHSFRAVKTVAEEDQVKAAFAHEAKNRCAEIGLLVDVEWLWSNEETGQQSPDVSDDPSDHTLYWNPRVVVKGRTDKLAEYDHDRQKFEVTTGAGGLEAGGFIRPDGTVTDEPKRKNIY